MKIACRFSFFIKMSLLRELMIHIINTAPTNEIATIEKAIATLALSLDGGSVFSPKSDISEFKTALSRKSSNGSMRSDFYKN